MRYRPLLRAALAGLSYVTVVFAVGFALGALRVLVLTPRLGENIAVLLELPIILAVSWFACRWLITRFNVPSQLTSRLIMGGLAFTILMIAELGVSVFVFGRTFSGHLGQYETWHSLLGLAGQITFAVFPLVQAAIARGNSD